MFRLALAIPAALAAFPALAFDPCEDLWFSRNQLYDRAGYCFSTPLGLATERLWPCHMYCRTARPFGEGFFSVSVLLLYMLYQVLSECWA